MLGRELRVGGGGGCPGEVGGVGCKRGKAEDEEPRQQVGKETHWFRRVDALEKSNSLNLTCRRSIREKR